MGQGDGEAFVVILHHIGNAGGQSRGEWPRTRQYGAERFIVHMQHIGKCLLSDGVTLAPLYSFNVVTWMILFILVDYCKQKGGG